MIRWNHTVEVWRDTPTEDEYGSTTELVRQNEPTRRNAWPDQAWAGDLQRHGGDRQSSNRVWYLERSMDVQQGDVLRVIAGPEAGTQWRVLTATHPTDGRGRVHHIEANCETYTAPLGAA